MSLAIKRPLYKHRGAQVEHGKTTFRVYAPHAKSVSLHLTSDKVHRQFQMVKDHEGVWKISSSKARPGDTYLFSVEEESGKKMLRTDPFSFSTKYIETSKRVESVVIDRKAHRWHDEKWMKERAKHDPLKKAACIYEVQGKSWKTSYKSPQNYKALAKELVAYCKKMNYTHVELYGLLDHLQASEHGYQIAHFLAPYQPQGSANDLKVLIDELHQAGVGVIVDWVMTHYYHKCASDNFCASLHKYDGTDLFGAEESPWGTLFFDYNKDETRRLMQASALYWLEEMHVDGLRFDAMNEMVNHGGKKHEKAIEFLKELNELVREKYPGVLLVAEDTGDFPGLTKKASDGGLGFDARWAIGWCKESREFLHTPPKERADEEHPKIAHFLDHVEQEVPQILSHSHDDCDISHGPNNDSLYNCVFSENNDEVRFAILRNFFAWQSFAPSRGYLMHMGDELGQRKSWYDRFQKKISSVDWSLEKSPKHQKLQKCVSDLNALYRKTHDLFKEGEKDFQLITGHSEKGVVAYQRGHGKKGRISVIHNFSDKGHSSFELPLKELRSKKITEIFNSDKSTYGGSGKFDNHKIEILKSKSSGEAHIKVAIAPNSTIVLQERL